MNRNKFISGDPRPKIKPRTIKTPAWEGNAIKTALREGGDLVLLHFIEQCEEGRISQVRYNDFGNRGMSSDIDRAMLRYIKSLGIKVTHE